jgi:hypothetical protein
LVEGISVAYILAEELAPRPFTPFSVAPLSHRGSWLGQVSSAYSFCLAYHNSDIQISSPRRFSMLVTTWPTTLWVTESPSVHRQKATTGSSSGCSSKIRLLLCPKSSLTRKHRDSDRDWTFTMCNPPFYASAREMERSAATKALPPRAVLTASANELLTAGGEVQFVGRMIDESLVLKTRCLYVCC